MEKKSSQNKRMVRPVGARVEEEEQQEVNVNANDVKMEEEEAWDSRGPDGMPRLRPQQVDDEEVTFLGIVRKKTDSADIPTPVLLRQRRIKERRRAASIAASVIGSVVGKRTRSGCPSCCGGQRKNYRGERRNGKKPQQQQPQQHRQVNLVDEAPEDEVRILEDIMEEDVITLAVVRPKKVNKAPRLPMKKAPGGGPTSIINKAPGGGGSKSSIKARGGARGKEPNKSALILNYQKTAKIAAQAKSSRSSELSSNGIQRPRTRNLCPSCCGGKFSKWGPPQKNTPIMRKVKAGKIVQVLAPQQPTQNDVIIMASTVVVPDVVMDQVDDNNRNIGVDVNMEQEDNNNRNTAVNLVSSLGYVESPFLDYVDASSGQNFQLELEILPAVVNDRNSEDNSIQNRGPILMASSVTQGEGGEVEVPMVPEKTVPSEDTIAAVASTSGSVQGGQNTPPPPLPVLHDFQSPCLGRYAPDQEASDEGSKKSVPSGPLKMKKKKTKAQRSAQAEANKRNDASSSSGASSLSAYSHAIINEESRANRILRKKTGKRLEAIPEGEEMEDAAKFDYYEDKQFADLFVIKLPKKNCKSEEVPKSKPIIWERPLNYLSKLKRPSEDNSFFKKPLPPGQRPIHSLPPIKTAGPHGAPCTATSGALNLQRPDQIMPTSSTTIVNREPGAVRLPEPVAAVKKSFLTPEFQRNYFKGVLERIAKNPLLPEYEKRFSTLSTRPLRVRKEYELIDLTSDDEEEEEEEVVDLTKDDDKAK